MTLLLLSHPTFLFLPDGVRVWVLLHEPRPQALVRVTSLQSFVLVLLASMAPALEVLIVCCANIANSCKVGGKGLLGSFALLDSVANIREAIHNVHCVKLGGPDLGALNV